MTSSMDILMNMFNQINIDWNLLFIILATIPAIIIFLLMSINAIILSDFLFEFLIH